MENIYSGEDSKYSNMANNWHTDDSPWKAKQILKIIKKNNIDPQHIVEVGCGAGEILYSMDREMKNPNVHFEGYDIAVDAIKMATSKTSPNIDFYCNDFTETQGENYDLLLMIDVFEHVPDYIGFIERCMSRAKYKIFHIPLEIHLSSILRNKLVGARESVGHLHYFTKETALATLEDVGLKVIDSFYTDGSSISTKWRTKFANIPRSLMFPVFPDLTVKLIGGYSLLVLAE